MSPLVETVLSRLEDARQRWWVFSLLCNVLLVISVSLGLLVLFILLDVWLLLSQAALAVLFVIWCATTVALLMSTAWRVLRRQRSLEAAARRVEVSFPELGSDLINLLQLVRSSNGAPEAFRKAAIIEAAARVQRVPFQAAARKHSRWSRWRLGLQTPRDLIEFSLLLFAVVAVTVLCSIAIPTWKSAADRLFRPWTFVPQVGEVRILEVSPGNTQVLKGTQLQVTARIARPENFRPEGRLLFRVEGDQREQSRPLMADENRQTYVYRFPAVTAPLQYRLEIGDSQSEVYRIDVREMPVITEVNVRYEYPPYLDLPPLTVTQQHADLQAPQYTTAHLALVASTDLKYGYVQLADDQIMGEVADDGRTLRVSIPMAEQGTYTIHLFNRAGQTDENPRSNRIRISPDGPPKVELLKPPAQSKSAPGDQLLTVVRASDDHGLGELRLEWKLDEGEAATSGDEPVKEAPLVLHEWPEAGGMTATTVSHTVTLSPERFPAGKTLLIRAVASDRRRITIRGNRLEPQETASPWHRIVLMAPQEAAAEELQQVESLNAKLWALLQSQVRARVFAAQMKSRESLEQVQQAARDVRQRQVQIQGNATSLVRSIDASEDPSRGDLKQALNKLANGHMVTAVQQAETLMAAAHMAAVAESLPALTETQDQIIDVLRRLLDLTRQMAGETLAEMEERPGGDLPDHVQEKLMELSEKLDEFIHQQRRIIEATENLAKKPVEDFTQEEEQLLQELAASEDEWSRFLEETHSDFSKLPEQDFANPSMLEELVEVQTEIKMAADALTKKTADIAVPLEQLGAEMAEELVSNLEKWLPDTPDRERWSQEEPLSDEMKEAPMAELPGELEDLVGELMEEEEDLFDEMEDVSSSWADSLDKGAGWDAADGPISNMSAKGVTGNRLPNTSEIGGRSGEGRQGKASGEFVADTAIGKGGRKTPSRLAPDPYVKGQVKDISKDPVGGATGGGKESGAGGEGLEGPVPPQQQRELQRMANRQADLRNRAEGVDLKFQVHGYHHTDLEKMIELMKAVEADLRAGRYQNALRRREVLLDGLGSIKTYLGGEYQLRQDQTTSLPEDIQKELLGSMGDPTPPGWESLTRQYFQRLAGEAESPGRNAPPSPDNASPADDQEVAP